MPTPSRLLLYRFDRAGYGVFGRDIEGKDYDVG